MCCLKNLKVDSIEFRLSTLAENKDARLPQTLPDALRDLSPLSLGVAARPSQCMAHCPRLSPGREAPRRAALIGKPGSQGMGAEVGRLEAEGLGGVCTTLHTAAGLLARHHE
jgi:hypothetical protein